MIKVVFQAVVVCQLAVVASYGQVFDAQAEEALSRAQEEKEQHARDLATGRRLFGADERWEKPEFRGSMSGKRLGDPYQIGDWGCTGLSFRIVGMVSNNECLAIHVYRGANVVLIRGLDMSKAADGVRFVLQHPFVVQETYSYTTTSGAEKTVIVLECNPAKVKELADAPWTRTWTDATGAFSVVAKFIDLKNGQITLERKDNGKSIEVSMARLCEEDQKWVRDELKRRKEEERKEAAEKRIQAKKKRRGR